MSETAYAIIIYRYLHKLQADQSKTSEQSRTNLARLKILTILTPLLAWTGVGLFMISSLFDDRSIDVEFKLVGQSMVGIHVLFAVLFNSRMRWIHFPNTGKKVVGKTVQVPSQDIPTEIQPSDTIAAQID